MREARSSGGFPRATVAAAVLVAALSVGCSIGRGSIGDAVDHGGSLVSEEGQIAFMRATNSSSFASLQGDVYLLDVDGSGEKKLTDSPGLNGFPAWSPDGEKIAFVSGRDGNWELYVMRADGSGQTRLTRTPEEDEAVPAWSPDGRRIAFVTDLEDDPAVHVMGLDGSGRERLADGNWPSWSPDGKRIVYTSGVWNDPRLSVMNADGSGQRTLDVRGASQPAWAPNGDKIAFTSDVGPNKNTWDNEEIFSMDADGSGQRRLTDISGNDHWPPTWSPDSTRIAFTSDGRAGVGDIYAMNADGSGLTRLTDDSASDAFPAWRP